jgi:hypothetical protein
MRRWRLERFRQLDIQSREDDEAVHLDDARAEFYCNSWVAQVIGKESRHAAAATADNDDGQ